MCLSLMIAEMEKRFNNCYSAQLKAEDQVLGLAAAGAGQRAIQLAMSQAAAASEDADLHYRALKLLYLRRLRWSYGHRMDEWDETVAHLEADGWKGHPRLTVSNGFHAICSDNMAGDEENLFAMIMCGAIARGSRNGRNAEVRFS